MAFDKRLLEWQRKLDPSNFNKKQGAKYHTAPSVVFPGSPDYPEGVPDESVTIMFYIPGDDWIGERVEHSGSAIEFIEEQPKGKSKSGWVTIWDAGTIIAIAKPTSNYYWSANTVANHKLVTATIRPSKHVKENLKHSDTQIIATFLPNPGEE